MTRRIQPADRALYVLGSLGTRRHRERAARGDGGHRRVRAEPKPTEEEGAELGDGNGLGLEVTSVSPTVGNDAALHASDSRDD